MSQPQEPSVQETTAMAGCRYRHKKRGTEYSVLGIGQMQTEHWVDMFEGGVTPVDMEEVAVYRGYDGQLWVRPREEFEDGRFEQVSTTPPPTTSSAVEALRILDRCEIEANRKFTEGLATVTTADIAVLRAALQAGTEVAATTPAKAALRAYAEASKGERCPICNGIEGCDHTVKERLFAALAPVQQAGVESELVEPVAWRYLSSAKDAKWTVQKNYPSQIKMWNGYQIEPLYSAASLSQLQQRIAEVERENGKLREYAREATKAITGLTAGGSEYFGKKIGDIYTADLPFCVGRIRERFEHEADWTRKSIAEKRAAEAALAASDAKLAEAGETAKAEELRIHHDKVDHLNARLEAEVALERAADQFRVYAVSLRGAYATRNEVADDLDRCSAAALEALVRARSFTSSIQEKGNGPEVAP